MQIESLFRPHVPKDLHTFVARIGNIDRIVAGNEYAVGQPELPRFLALLADGGIGERPETIRGSTENILPLLPGAAGANLCVRPVIR